MYAYPYTIEDDDGTKLLQFVDIGIAHTVGESEEEAIANAIDALESAIIAIMDGKGSVPHPSRAGGRPTVTLPPLSAAKVELYRAMRKLGITKAALARKLSIHPPQVDRLLDLRHASKLEQIEQAFSCLGKEIEIRVRDKKAA
jgi:antitoxin HicB